MRTHSLNSAFSLKPLAFAGACLLAAIFAATPVIGHTQTAAPAAPPAGQSQEPSKSHWGRDPAKMQAKVAERLAQVKSQLAITAPQEAAWNAFAAAMQPSASMAKARSPEARAAQRAELDKLDTPERIDKMTAQRKEQMAQMDAAMTQRANATKALYAVLDAPQQKSFDLVLKKFGRHAGAGHRGHSGYRSEVSG